MSKIIEMYMRENNLNAKGLAQRAGVGPNIIRKLLSGDCRVDLRKVFLVAITIGVSSYDLIEDIRCGG